MLPKSIFLLLRALVARQIPNEVGKKFCVTLGFDGVQEWLSGTVVQVTPYTHGTLIVARNNEWKNLNYTCSGWEYLPIWISKCGGSSGIVATWKEEAVKSAVSDLVARVDREIDNMMAL